MPATDFAAFEPRFVSPWLARKDADWWVDRLYDFAADSARRSCGRALAHGHRRQSRSLRRLALSGPGDHRTLPDDDLRRRAALSRRAGAGRDEIAERRGDAISIPIMPPCAARSPACARAIPTGRALRLPLDPLAIPRLFEASCRTSTSAPTAARAAIAALRDAVERSCRRERPSLGHQRPLQGRLDHPPLRRSGRGRPRHPDGARLPRLHGRAASAVATGRHNWPRAVRRRTCAACSTRLRACRADDPRETATFVRHHLART